jgi:hypothetical protein
MGKGNELWVVVLLELANKSSSLVDSYLHNGILDQIKTLIQEYDPLFQEPSSLPPPRSYDDSITLLPNSVPVSYMPYRYFPDQKDEIERQVSSMMKSGIVVPNLSPFASLVLLVKKKDGSWMF